MILSDRVLGVIPARYASTRFPAKPLAKILGKSMIYWTYTHALQSKRIDKLVVATDHPEIEAEVLSFGGQVVMTSPDHPTGTDRLIEVATQFEDYDCIVNIQGDEPGIEAELIDGVIETKLSNPNGEMATAAVLFESLEEAKDPNRVKVVFDRTGRALYFSRSLIPCPHKSLVSHYRHLGIYAYNRDYLLNYNSLPSSDWEIAESLEQLRGLQTGAWIGVFLAKRAAIGVDLPSDIALVEEEFRKKRKTS